MLFCGMDIDKDIMDWNIMKVKLPTNIPVEVYKDLIELCFHQRITTKIILLSTLCIAFHPPSRKFGYSKKFDDKEKLLDRLLYQIHLII